MNERLVALLLDEGKWIFASMLFALFTVVVRFARRAPGSPARVEIVRAMNLFTGCMIGMMAFGHLLAISIKAVEGTLSGSPLLLYPLGIVLLVPAVWLGRHATRLQANDADWTRRATVLNATLAISLLAFGLNNLPLALPAALNVAYLRHSRRLVGWTILTATVAVNGFLFVGSLIFLASGQSFEEFRGM